MASKFWVAGGSSTNWNATANTNWANTSGGTGNQTAPTAGDSAFLDANSGAGTVTINTGVSLAVFDCTGFVGTLAGAFGITITGSTFKFASGMTVSWTGSATFSATSGTTAITSAGKSFPGSVTMSGVGGTFQPQDAFSMTGQSSFLSHANGVFDANGFNVTIANQFDGSGSSTRTLTMGSGLWTVGRWDTNSTGLTFNKNTANIAWNKNFTTNSAFFNGGGLTFNDITITSHDAYAPYTFTTAATFAHITLTAPLTLQVTDGVTITVQNAFNWAGTSFATGGFRISTDAITGITKGNISVASGAPTMSYAIIYGMNFTGGATFTATNSIDFGNNSGITITAPSSGGGGISRARAAAGF